MPAGQPFWVREQQHIVHEGRDRGAGGARPGGEVRHVSTEPKRSGNEQAVAGGEVRRGEPDALALRPTIEQCNAVVRRK